MGYIGRGLNQTGGQYRKLDNISSSFNGSTTSFNLTIDGLEVTPTAQNLLISINGVIQEPNSSFSTNGSTITFTEAPDAASTFFGIVMGEASFISYGTVGANEIGVTAGAVSASAGVVVDSAKNITGFNSVTADSFTGTFNGALSGSAQISSDISGSSTSLSSSLATRTTVLESASGSDSTRITTIEGRVNQGVKTTDSPTFSGATINGTLTASEIHTTFVSSSVATITGSNVFGDAVGDLHSFTGSVSISGSQTSLVITDNLSVDGTTNLNNTDIDGTLTVDGGNIVFNEDSADQDFRVESNDNANMLVVDGGNNRVGIGVSPSSTLDVTSGETANTANFTSTSGATNITLKSSSTLIGQLEFQSGAVSQIVTRTANSSLALGSNNVQTLFITDDDNVGIGTDSPTTKFEVYDGSSGTDFTTVEYDYNSKNRKLRFGIAGGNPSIQGTLTNDSTTSLAINPSGGNVGIGTATPGVQLDIYNTDHAVMRLLAGTNKSASMRLRNDAQDWDVNLQTNDNFAIYDQTGGANALTIAPSTYAATFSGDVTISKSSAKMTVFASNTGDHESIVIDRNTASNGDSQEIRWKLQGDSYPGGYISHEYEDASNSTLAFGVRVSGTPTTTMLLKSNKDVRFSGVILADQSSTSDFGNTAFKTVDGNDHNGVRIEHGGGNGRILLYSANSHRGTITANQHTAHTNGLTIGSTANEACDIVTNGTSNIRMRVANNGNIGLGTLSPSYRLHVYQDSADYAALIQQNQGDGAVLDLLASASDDHGNDPFFRCRTDAKTLMQLYNDGTFEMGAMGTNNDGIQMRADSGDGGLISVSTSTESAQNRVRFYNGNGLVGTIQTNGSSTSYNESSDYRLKENEVPLSDGLERLLNLKPYKFNFKKDKDTIVDGFFAHEVQEFVPNAVCGEKDGEEMQQIDHSKLVPLLVASIQELSAQIEELKS